MRILLITQWFEPEPTFKGLAFAKELRRLGHEVEVLTGFPNYPGGKIYPGYRIRLFQCESLDGIRVTRVPLYPSHNRSKLGRALNYGSFSLTSALLGCFLTRRADVAYFYHPPATAALAPILFKFLKDVPFVIDVHDLWPDSLAATGMMSSPRILSWVGRWCQLVYYLSSRVVVISPGFRRRLVDQGVPPEKVVVNFNWADVEREDAPGATPGIPEFTGRFNVVFAGTMGKAQALDTVLEAAGMVADRVPAVQFVLIGGGIERDRLIARSNALGLKNILFLPRRPMSEIAPVLKASDVLLVHLKNDPLFRITIPSKTQAYLSIGRPILMALPGDAAELVERAGAGIVCASEDPRALANAIETLAKMQRSDLEEMGRKGREFYDRELSLPAGVKGLERILKRASDQSFYQDFWQRGLDLILALPASLLLCPAAVVIFIVARLKLGSPVIFRQVRPGRFGKPFVLYKFRTMTEQRSADGRVLPDDQRLTRFGMWMRRYSLDELPQLWNVLRGDLSLVGPRPLLMEYLTRYTAEQARRHDVKPGITGWAQVNGRNAIEWERKFELDLEYVKKRSLFLYFRVLLLTVRKVIDREGISRVNHATTPEFKGK